MYNYSYEFIPLSFFRAVVLHYGTRQPSSFSPKELKLQAEIFYFYYLDIKAGSHQKSPGRKFRRELFFCLWIQTDSCTELNQAYTATMWKQGEVFPLPSCIFRSNSYMQVETHIRIQ